jgi:glycosyltransferase involved in cell wall biosynthesis
VKITHVATSLSGGAGIAARRIAEAQHLTGMDVNLIAGNGDDSTLKSYEKIYSKSGASKITSKSLTYAQAKIIQKGLPLVTPLSISSEILAAPEISEADVVHFHAFYNLASVIEIGRLSQLKKVVVTLHDQRFFTGGCHYSFDCKEFRLGCFKCPQVHQLFNKIPEFHFRQVQKESSNFKDIQFIAPSKWLAELAKTSKLLNGSKILTINNPIPDTFHPQATVRSNKEIKIGFVSENLNNPYKGLTTLVDALEKIGDEYSFNLRLFGNGNLPINLNSIKHSISTFKGESAASRAYKSCDLIVVPSLEDNSPSVISEALMSGIPVIGSDAGGIPEILRDFNMPIFERGNSESLIRILKNIKNFEIDIQTQSRISDRFSYENSSKQHQLTYQELKL